MTHTARLIALLVILFSAAPAPGWALAPAETLAIGADWARGLWSSRYADAQR